MRSSAHLVLLVLLGGAFIDPVVGQPEVPSSVGHGPNEQIPAVGSEIQQGPPMVVQTGTGFVVHEDGIILTNAHVVEGCRTATVGAFTSERMVSDEQNDMALLFVETPVELVPLSFSPDPIRLGAAGFAFGFPLQDFLARSLNVTEGVVSSLAGIGGDTRFIQMSAPVQLGNSGGPLIDNNGTVIGMVTEKLNAITVAAIIGNIPEGVSFALRREIILAFLSANGVEANFGRSLRRPLDIPDVVNRVEDSVLPVACTPSG
jgi:S1-C subfamily serine protease